VAYRIALFLAAVCNLCHRTDCDYRGGSDELTRSSKYMLRDSIMAKYCPIYNIDNRTILLSFENIKKLGEA